MKISLIHFAALAGLADASARSASHPFVPKKKIRKHLFRSLLQTEAMEPGRQLVSTECADANTDLNTGNPQFTQYNQEVVDALPDDCGGFCQVDGKEVKGSDFVLDLVGQCEGLNGTPFVENYRVECGTVGILYVDNLLSCVPIPPCTEGDGKDLNLEVKVTLEAYMKSGSDTITCEVEHEVYKTSTSIERCENALEAEADTLEKFDNITTEIYEYIEEGCASPPCSVDGRELIGPEVFDQTEKDCRAIDMDVWIDEFAVDECADEKENHEAKNIIWCVPQICNTGDYHEHWDDTEDLEEMFPTCDVEMSFTINGEAPSSGSGDNINAKTTSAFRLMVAVTTMVYVFYV